MTPLPPPSGASMPRAPGAVDVELPEAWAIETMFGGAIAAALANAAMTSFDPDWFGVVETAVRFLRPTPAGPARIEFAVLSSGRSYSTIECRLVARERITAVALVTISARASVVDLAPDPFRPELPQAASAGSEFGLEGVVDWRASSDWWSDEDSDAEFRSWISFRPVAAEAALRLDAAASRYLIASDLIGPALVAAGIRVPFRIATVSLSVTTVAVSASPWLEQRIRVRSTHPDAIAEVELRDPAGTLLATATQRAVVLSATRNELPFAVTGFGWGRAINIPVLVEE